MKKIPKWIIFKFDIKPNVFMCDRCGATREAHLPAAVSDFTRQAEAFSESHKYCKEHK